MGFFANAKFSAVFNFVVNPPVPQLKYTQWKLIPSTGVRRSTRFVSSKIRRTKFAATALAQLFTVETCSVMFTISAHDGLTSAVTGRSNVWLMVGKATGTGPLPFVPGRYCGPV